MTIRQKLENVLVNHFLSADEAKQVLDLAIQKSNPEGLSAVKAFTPMHGRWNDDVTTYPTTILSVLLLPLREEAYRLIKHTKPMHFCLMFLREEIGEDHAAKIDGDLASLRRVTEDVPRSC